MTHPPHPNPPFANPLFMVYLWVCEATGFIRGTALQHWSPLRQTACLFCRQETFWWTPGWYINGDSFPWSSQLSLRALHDKYLWASTKWVTNTNIAAAAAATADLHRRLNCPSWITLPIRFLHILIVMFRMSTQLQTVWVLLHYYGKSVELKPQTCIHLKWVQGLMKGSGVGRCSGPSPPEWKDGTDLLACGLKLDDVVWGSRCHDKCI